MFFFYNKNKVERKGVIGIRGPREDLISEQTPVKHTKTNNDGFYSDVNVIILGGEISPEYLCEFALIFSQVNEIKVSYISEIPEGNQFYNLDNDPIQQSVKRRLKAMSESIGKEIHFNSITTYDLVGTLYHLSNIKQTNWIITEGSSHKQGLLTFHNPFGWIKKRLSSNLAIYKNKGIRYIKNILIYYRKNDHFDFLLTTSLHLSQYYKAGVTLLTYEDQEQTKETLNNLNKLHNLENIKISQYQKNKTQLNQLIHLTSEYDLLIFESCALDFWHTIFSEENHILKYATCSVLAIRANTRTPIT